ncbi:MAG TPA: M1 family aminopeptidase [Blastocatellia bacterium]|jgi:aminopeptidase N
MKAVKLLSITTALTLLLPLWPTRAQSESIFEQIRREHDEIEKYHSPSPAASLLRPQATAAQSIDVTHYRLQIRLEFNPAMIRGSVTINLSTVAPASSIAIDAQSNLTVDAVRFDQSSKEFQRTNSQIKLNFPEPLAPSSDHTIAIDYHGPPSTSNLLGGGMLNTSHNGSPVMANLSEPYAAPSWWPCIDNAADKATAETEITVPAGMSAASNGVLQKTEVNSDSTQTFFWREDYPLSTYLVSVAATNYVRFEDAYASLDGSTTLPLVFMVYPEHEQLARQKFAVTREAIETLAPLYGEYPFINEKYGMVEFPWSGGMEHQTMTSLGSNIIGSASNTGRGVIVHELGHQWWGDLVTMADWHDIWLNEGFATFTEVLFYERALGLAPGDVMSQSYDDGSLNGALGGTVHAENLDNPFDDRGAIYTKGAWVLHMLRHVMGDEKFFSALREYGRRFAFSNASTVDFQSVCEEFFDGSLEWFFSQWIYAPARPLYKISSSISPAGNQFTVKLTIKQKQSHTIPGRDTSTSRVYIMPLDVTLHYADGSSETRVIWNDKRKQKFSFTVDKRPDRVALDENDWVLKKVKGGS